MKLPNLRASQSIAFPQNDIILKFLTLQKTRVLRHLAFLLFFLLLAVGGRVKGEYSGIFDHIAWIVSYMVIVGLFYINMYFLIPWLFYRGKYVFYLLALATAIAVGWLILWLFQEWVLEPNRLLPDKNEAFSFKFLLIVIVFMTPFYLTTTALKLFQRWIADVNRMKELETKALESELKALRNQIQPHFLFNMLNNINVLTKKDPEKASVLIVKLSDFLRYLLYESNQTQVYLLAEIKFITDFLNLEKIRRDNFEFEINYAVNQIKGVHILPHMLVTLVENAIKHSSDPLNDSYVNIIIKVEQNKLYFSCSNSVPTFKKEKPKESGVGLVNISRRLELLYFNSYSLDVNQSDKYYTVTLILPI